MVVGAPIDPELTADAEEGGDVGPLGAGAGTSLRPCDVLHPESKQQTTPAAPRDALECVAALARTRENRQNCVRFAYRGPQVDRFHVLELKRDVE